MRSMGPKSSVISFDAFTEVSCKTVFDRSLGIFVAVVFSGKVFFCWVGKWPCPLSSQYNSTSGNWLRTLRTNSKLGLFRPESRWEIGVPIDLLSGRGVYSASTPVGA